MPDRHYIIGTAGHIDHGKSSLIEALTGTDPDRLPEEKQRGMTIELGFASLALPASDGSGDTLALGVVDVPGHADFVKNMVAGVGAVDLAVFVVAADDGWMPQTEEHYQILDYLGVERAVVALTKMDLVEGDVVELALEELRENLEGGRWADAPVVAVSSKTGTGVEELKRAVAGQLAAAAPVRDCGKPRLPVDRAFSLKGVGTVVTGTLIDGALRSGAELAVEPGGGTAHVRTAQSHGAAVETVPPGTRTAVNLAGLSLREGRGAGRGGVGRGDVLVAPACAGGVTAIDAELCKSGRGIRGFRHSTRPVRTGREVMFHHGSSGVPARLHLLGARTLEPDGRALAELRFREPVHVFAGDRFVLRDASLGLTLAGGEVLDEDANRRAFRKPWQRDFLEARAGRTGDLDVMIRSQMKRDKAVHLPSLLAKSRFGEAEVKERAGALAAGGELEISGPWAFEGEWWRRVSQLAAGRIEAVHRENPDHLGMPLRELRALVEPELPAKRFFDILLGGLLAGDYAKAGPNIRHREHRPRLPEELVAAGERVRKRLAGDLKNPPNRGETAASPAEEKALRFLVHTGEVVDLDAKTVISAAGYERIAGEIVAHLREHGRATASDLRQATGTVRRILMPLLERLDEEGVTRREGDDRVLR